AGPTLDRLLTRAVPAQVVAQIDDSVNLLAKKPPLDEQDDEAAPVDEADRLTASLSASALSLDELAQDEPGKDQGLITLADPDPVRFLQGQLHELWKEAVNTLASQPRPGASGSSKAPGQIAIQGMANKQIELTTPPFRTTGSAGKPILAIWIYRDNSLVISHLD